MLAGFIPGMDAILSVWQYLFWKNKHQKLRHKFLE
jgi:hypothetical protein